jgi:glycosyltransferase involved in cell wall biosynthesis
LKILAGGQRQDVLAFGMPRLDPYVAEGEPEAYRSGFWAMVTVPAGVAGPALELALEAELEDGRTVVAELGHIPFRATTEEMPVPWPPAASGPRVAICMATYNPPPDLFERQLESIRSQTHGNWVCLISDDCSAPERYSAIRDAVADDARFVVSRSPRRLGFYGNFERVLSAAPREAEYVAMADQDDYWHPDKIETLLQRVGGAKLVYSDARVVSNQAEVISGTWWNRRRNNHSDLLSVLVANSVTGAAALVRREVLDYALPFPPSQFAHFHDHWIALVALALGEISFVDRALYDYVQHGNASLGHEAANRLTPLRERLGRQRDLRERVRLWRLHYFVDVCRLLQFATVLEMRCGGRMTPAKRQALGRFAAAGDSFAALATLAARGLRDLVGPTETLGAEWMLACAFGWRRLLSATARERPQRALRLDAVPPPSLIQAPGRRALPHPVRELADKVAPLRWSLSDTAPARINLLIPSVDLRHLFGGYIAKLNLARRLAERGERVRIVTVDPPGSLPPRWREEVEAYAGLSRLFERVEVVFGRESPGIEVGGSDLFIATTWWTAHIAADALRAVGGQRFLYLIQEYEPMTFPMGSYAALAEASYRLPHFALFSSRPLRDYFRLHRIGVYAAGADPGVDASAVFENAITNVGPLGVDELRRRRTRRLLFYARPEPHAARNLFELGVLALLRALEDGVLHSGWELSGIGTVQDERRMRLGDGVSLNLLPRLDQAAYARLLRDHDVGLGLMYTPHPSLVPLEMAAAGMLAVTNSFENKSADVMSAISTNIITAEPSVEGIAAGLREAVARTADVEARVAGAAVHWSRSWERSFEDALLDRVVSALRVQASDVLEGAVNDDRVREAGPGDQYPGLDVHRLPTDEVLEDPRRA